VVILSVSVVMLEHSPSSLVLLNVRSVPLVSFLLSMVQLLVPIVWPDIPSLILVDQIARLVHLVHTRQLVVILSAHSAS
jgi:hypothetical protein